MSLFTAKEFLFCLFQNWCNWPDESFEEMDSTLAVQQVIYPMILCFILKEQLFCFMQEKLHAGKGSWRRQCRVQCHSQSFSSE